MRAISKQALLKLIDEHLPDDAMISGLGGMAGDAFELTQDNMDTIFSPAEEQDPEDIITNSTYVLVTL